MTTNRHCEGPRPTDEPAVTTTTVADPITTTAADDEHTDAAGTGSLAPSPTESIGCEPHGDHWHCEGPRPPAETETGSTSETSVATLTTLTTTASTPSRAPTGTGAPTTTTTGTGPIVTAGAAVGVPMVGAAPVLGMVVFAALGL